MGTRTRQGPNLRTVVEAVGRGGFASSLKVPRGGEEGRAERKKTCGMIIVDRGLSAGALLEKGLRSLTCEKASWGDYNSIRRVLKKKKEKGRKKSQLLHKKS